MSKNSNYLFKLDLLILSLIKDKDMYTYDIVKTIKEKTNGTIVPKNGTIYPIIYKLIEDNYVTSYTKLINNKARVYYHIEERGLLFLEQLINEYNTIVKNIDLIVYGGHNSDR